MPRDWQQTAATSPLAANRHLVDADLLRIGRRQKQLVRSEQLTAAGLSARAIRHRAAAGTLHRVHREVYSLTPPPHGRQQLWLAAVYACGPGSSLSDLCAAAHFGLYDNPPLTAHITNPTGTGRTRKGITVHRRRLERCDLTVHLGIPCTSVARTILDCSHVLGAEAIEDLLMAADSFPT